MNNLSPNVGVFNNQDLPLNAGSCYVLCLCCANDRLRRKGSNASLFSMPLLIVSGFLLLGCDPEPVAITPKLVVVEEVKQATVPVYGNYVGITKASLDVEVRARVDGFVEERLFTEGSAVNAGDILYKIDNKPITLWLIDSRPTSSRSRRYWKRRSGM